MREFLPATRDEMTQRGWEHPDFVLVSGDPYIDHPSFGTAVIGRVLENAGYKVAVLAQPDWRTSEDFMRYGRPRLGFFVTSGSIDSMVANYTASRRRRREDSLSPGGRIGMRPDRAVIVYTNRCREAYRDVPVVLGGIEASLRRFAHYDYWDDAVRRSVLLDAKADLIIYGMGERAAVSVADALNDGFTAADITWVPGTVFKGKEVLLPADTVLLPSYEALTAQVSSSAHKSAAEYYNESFVLKYDNNEAADAKVLAERYDKHYVIQNPPQTPLSTAEFDAVYDLPFTYAQHPIYDTEADKIPALHEIQFSITHVRGCYGNCAFCAITSHQGRTPTGRSLDSVIQEAERMTRSPDFKGYIHDVGGPTANISGPACDKMASKGACKRKDCLFPEPCTHLQPDHRDYLKMLRALRALPDVKKVFIRSGIRYDLVLADKVNGRDFARELTKYHVSGILKVAPEHTQPKVLKVMRKPAADQYEAFVKLFREADDHKTDKIHPEVSQKPRKPQYLLPYYISAHPGCDLQSAFDFSAYIEAHGGFVPDQIQDFYPTPGTLSTCIYYTGKDPFTREDVYVPGRNPAIPDERKLHRAILHHNKPENKAAYARATALRRRNGAIND
ncbi:MAG: YgiQ family radical SAM protein [Clostridiales Family XIII bacterium]|jgi:uncharacterized radical SAM protein YgiQ|nr:YgiQ family radical SAM protein [Clostridiales Family XIII bacterium]